MTLIASTVNKNTPVIIGDILFSHKVDKRRKIQIPTNSFDISEHLELEDFPHSLSQKIYTIEKNVCIALAGTKFEMKNLLSELKLKCRYFSNQEITREIIETILLSFDLEEKYTKSAFLITLINNNIIQHLYYPNNYWSITEHKVFNEIYACGSGKESFIDQANQVGTVVELGFNYTNTAHALTNNIIFLAKLLAIEKVTLSTVKEYWGAGYELIYFDGEKFKKVDEIGYLIFICEFNEDGKITNLVPRSFLYHTYHKDTLMIRTIQLFNGTESIINSDIKYCSSEYQADAFIVPSIDEFEDDYKKLIPDNLSFKTSNIAVAYICMKQKNNSTIPFIPSFYSISDKIVEVEYVDGNSIEIKVDTIFQNNILQEAEERFLNI